MRIENNVPLRELNTFGVAATARHFAEARSDSEAREAAAWAASHGERLFVLGGGSNILFTGDVDGLVLRMATKGITTREEAHGKVLVTAAAGEDWPDLVWRTVAEGLGGIENLSMIPGTAGAAPVQNIGAYGVEFGDTCRAVTAFSPRTGETREFTAGECRFGYRDSIFKRAPGQWIITSVTLALDRNAPLRTDYGALQQELDKQEETGLRKNPPCFADVAKAVAAVREQKLPSLDRFGCAGSFFKNPVVPEPLYRELRATYPEMPGFAQPYGTVKLSAAWLLDTAGWKGKRSGRAGCYANQPLVLVNHEKTGDRQAGAEIVRFSEEIQADIEKRFNVRLEREVVTWP